jgi:hypothetical protein
MESCVALIDHGVDHFEETGDVGADQRNTDVGFS